MPPLLLRCTPLALLVLYSGALVGIELLWSAELARHLCTDIVGPTRLFALNTSLCSGMLLSAAVLLWFAARVGDVPPSDRRYFRLQALLFAYLGVDDRFLLHETWGRILRIDDALVLLALGVAQLGLLWRLGRLRARSRAARLYLVGAGVAFGVMVVIDGFAAHLSALPRLTLEDGAKAWGAGLLLAFAWELSACACAPRSAEAA
jgi:hypothetical protein